MFARVPVLTLFTAFLFSVGRPAVADISIFGDRLTISSDTVLLAFKGGDLVRVKNKLTGEDFIRTTTPQRPVLDMGMIKAPTKPYINFGWHQGKAEVNPETAQIQFNDQTRSIWMNVIVDHETNDVMISIWGEANREGVTGLTWGLRGLDLSGGKLILPVQGGRYVDASVPINEFSYSYPGDWEAQLAVWQTKTGGFVIYSRDDEARYKRITMARRASFADILLETEAEGPFEKAGGVPHIEWRFNAYKGTWQVPANGFRNLMHFYRPPAKISKDRAWVKDIRSVATIRGPKQDPKLLDSLAKQLDPSKTLLYVPDWRKSAFDVNYPDYDWNDTIRDFVDHAHELGFKVMLHAEMTGVSPSHADYQRLRKYQVCDPMTGKPVGRRWESADSDPRRYAIINPASETWRNTFLGRIRPVIDQVQPDALFLAGAGTLLNDGNAALTRRNFAEGCMALERALLTAYPRLALGVDGLNELTGPYCWFASRKAQPGLPPHAISEYLFGDHVLSFADPGLPQADTAPGAWAAAVGILEGQGVLPGLVLSTPADLSGSKPGVRQVVEINRAWQAHDFSPFWQSEWGANRFVWQGADGIPAAVEIQPAGTRLRVGSETLAQRISGVPSVASPDRIPGWPGYDENGLHGLSASRTYASMPGPRSKDAIHIPVLGPGAVIEWAQISPEFALFGFEPRKKETAAPFPMEVALPAGLAVLSIGGNAGTPEKRDGRLAWPAAPPTSWVSLIFKPGSAVTSGQDLVDLPHESVLVSAGIANPLENDKPSAVSAGGVEKAKGLHATPSGESVHAHTLVIKIPEAGGVLTFQAGVADDSTGKGVDLEARVDGETVWKTGRTSPGWEAGQADLGRWKGKTIVLQLVARSRTEFGEDHAVWAEVVIR